MGNRKVPLFWAAHNSRGKQIKLIFPRFMLHDNKQQNIKIEK